MKSIRRRVYCSSNRAISLPRGWPIASARSHAVPMALASARVPGAALAEAVVGEGEGERQHEGQQAEHAADHHADAVALRLAPRGASAAEPIAEFVRAQLENE